MKKNEIQRILVPVDFTETSDLAIAEAMTLAKQLNAEIFLLHVIESNGYLNSIFPESGLMSSPTTDEIKTAVGERMDGLQASIKEDYDITTAGYMVNGHIYTEIVKFCNLKDIDLIVMGTHGATGYKELFMGSNAQHVIHRCEVPVITIRNKKDKLGFKNILIPIDDSLHSREKVNMAITIAKAFQSHIHLVGLPDSKEQEDINKITIKLHSMEDLIKLEELPYDTTVMHGSHLARTAIEYSQHHECDLIVINTGHESELGGIFLGAFAQQIVNHATVPVLSFKHTEDHFSITTAGYGGV